MLVLFEMRVFWSCFLPFEHTNHGAQCLSLTITNHIKTNRYAKLYYSLSHTNTRLFSINISICERFFSDFFHKLRVDVCENSILNHYSRESEKEKATSLFPCRVNLSLIFLHVGLCESNFLLTFVLFCFIL